MRDLCVREIFKAALRGSRTLGADDEEDLQKQRPEDSPAGPANESKCRRADTGTDDDAK